MLWLHFTAGGFSCLIFTGIVQTLSGFLQTELLAIRSVESLKSLEVLIPFNRLFFRFCKKNLCSFGEGAGEGGITSLVEEELLIVLGYAGLAVDRERVLTLSL